MDNWTPLNREYAPPKPDEPEVHRAARTGDHAAIRSFADRGADLNLVHNIGLDPGARPTLATPLMVAAGSGNGATVQTLALLIELGANVMQVENERSAASFACTGLGWNYRPGGDAERLQWLLNAGCPLNLAGQDGNRVFCKAAVAGDAERLRLLLDRGADPAGYFDAEEARESERSTGLGEGFEEMLLAAVPQAPKDLCDLLTGTAADLQREMAERLASGPYSFEIPLFAAVESGSPECAALLLERGAHIHARDNSSRTAIWYAPDEAMMRLLLEHGLSLEDRDDLDWTPLDDAISDGPDSLARVEAMISLGADVNTSHDQGWTVFMSAVSCMERSRQIMELLVHAGADPLAVTDLGYNAFHAAVDVNGEANCEESVRTTLGYLKELGVDVNHRNEAGRSPLARAIQMGTSIEVCVLIELGADVNALMPRPMCCCCEDGCSVDESIEEPLVFAAIALAVDIDAVEKLEALLQGGVSLGVANEAGQSPLDFALAELRGDEEALAAGEGSDDWVAASRRCVELLRAELKRE
jgi:ankyrin repeat protein